jgi:hypothetical protein
VILFSNTWFASTPSWIGFGGDPAIFAWMLRWSPFAWAHHLNPLVTTYLNYPEGVNLMWNTSLPAPALLLAPVTNGLGAVTAFNVLTTAALALSAWAAYFAIRDHAPWPPAALCGGLLYGFSPYMVGQSEGHPSLTLAVFPPLVLVLLHRILLRPRRRLLMGFLLGLAGAFQLVTSEEILAGTAIVAVLGLVLLAALHRRQAMPALRAGLPALALATVVALGLSAFPLYEQLLGPLRVSGRLQPSDFFVSDLLAFIVPGQLLLFKIPASVSLAARFTGNFVENGAYLGLPLVLLLGWLVLRLRARPEVRYFGLLAAFTALLSMGPHLHIGGRTVHHLPLPWIGVQHLPLMENALPVRYILFTNLALGVLLAVAVEQAWQRRGAARTVLFAGAAVSLLALLPALPFNTTVAPIPRFFHSAAARIPEGSVALLGPYTEASSSMLAQEEAGLRFRMPEGHLYVPGPFNGNPPSALGQELAFIDAGVPGTPRTPELRTRLRADLVRWRVATVVVQPYPRAAEMAALMEWVLGRAPERVEGVKVWWEVGSMSAFAGAGPG